MIKPRGTQQETINKCLEVLLSKAPKRGVVVAPTAYGKSIIVANVAKELEAPCLILQPNKELLKQNVEKYESYGEKASVYSASLNSKEVGNVIFATIGSIVKDLPKLKELGVKYLVIDEAHRGTKKGSQIDTLVNYLGIKNILGLTATPISLKQTMEGTKLSMLNRDRDNIFKTIHHVVQIKELVEGNFWTPLEYKKADIDLSHLKLNTVGTEFTKESIIENYIKNNLEEVIIESIEKFTKNNVKSILVFVPRVEDVKILSEIIPDSRGVWGDMKASERDKNLKDFAESKYNVLINCEMLQIGYDNPNLEALIMATPTNSVGLFYQILGRLVRIKEGKNKATVLDLVGNVNRFGRIEDFTFEEQPYTKGWAMFSGEKILTGFPLGDIMPTRETLSTSMGPIDGQVRFHFGKMKDKTVGEVFEESPGYLTWLANNKDFTWEGDKNKKLKSEIFNILRLPLS